MKRPIAIGLVSLLSLIACGKSSPPQPASVAASADAPTAMAAQPVASSGSAAPAAADAGSTAQSPTDALADSRGDWKSPLDTYHVHQ